MSCLEKQTPQKVFLELHTRKSVIWKDLQTGRNKSTDPRTSSNLLKPLGGEHMRFPRWHCSI